MSGTIASERAVLLANLLETMKSFARVRPTGCVREERGVTAVYSGRKGAVFNAVLLSAPVGSESELMEKLEEVDRFFQGFGARWSLWLVEDLVPMTLLPRLGRLLDRFGLVEQSRGSGMIADAIAPPRRALPVLEVLPVGAPSVCFDFCQVMSVAFVTPLATFLDVYNGTEYWSHNVRGYVAYWEGRSVATACTVVEAGAVGIYGVSTRPDMQRKGIGEALMRYVLREAQREGAPERTVLEATDAALRLYKRLGYRKITGVTVYNEASELH